MDKFDRYAPIIETLRSEGMNVYQIANKLNLSIKDVESVIDMLDEEYYTEAEFGDKFSSYERF